MAIALPPTTGIIRPAVGLRDRMACAALVAKHVFGDGRLGTFAVLPAVGRLWDFQAGQYVTIGIDTPAGFVARPYSLASSPLDGDRLEFYIARVPEGRLTPHLFDLEPGAEVRLLAPKGQFTLAAAARSTVVMVATGTGLAPFLSQLRTLRRLRLAGIPPAQRMVLIHGVSHADELGYRAELGALAASAPDLLTYLPTCSRPDPARGWTSQIGRGRAEALAALLLGQQAPEGPPAEPPAGADLAALRASLDPAQAAVMACGNPGMIRSLEDIARAWGAPEFLSEWYWRA